MIPFIQQGCIQVTFIMLQKISN